MFKYQETNTSFAVIALERQLIDSGVCGNLNPAVSGVDRSPR